MGWIKLERSLTDHWIWQEPEALKLWIALLLAANFTTKKRSFNGSVVEIKRGQLVYGRHAFSAKLGISEAKLRRYIKLFISDSMISQQKTNKYSIISITCYEKYQDANQQITGHQPDNRPHHKNQEGKKETTKRFKPPTTGEVEEYCTSRSNGINPESFVDFYEARAWQIGANKMKNWKAAVRTWENRRKDQQPVQQNKWELEK
tara:strand:+ start:189 stop:800 length:612 start_codon:yes stop_codon:yes gene_type:complete